MNMCRLCRVHPGVVNVKGFNVCHGCLGKSVHAIGAVANHVFNPETCPPLSHCTDSQVVGQSTSTSSTAQSAITVGIGLALVAALAGVLYLYSQESGSSSRSPIKFGFGLEKSSY
jgi:hypothetical protein